MIPIFLLIHYFFFVTLVHFNPFDIPIKGFIIDPVDPKLPIAVQTGTTANGKTFRFPFVANKGHLWNISEKENCGQILICFTALNGEQAVLFIKMLTIVL